MTNIKHHMQQLIQVKCTVVQARAIQLLLIVDCRYLALELKLATEGHSRSHRVHIIFQTTQTLVVTKASTTQPAMFSRLVGSRVSDSVALDPTDSEEESRHHDLVFSDDGEGIELRETSSFRGTTSPAHDEMAIAGNEEAGVNG
jgi:hypothetical protein